MALILLVFIIFSTASISKLNVFISLSTNIGFAPKYSPTSTVATNVYVGAMNKSPFFKLIEANDRCRPAVHEFRAITYFACNIFFNFCSKILTFGPVVNLILMYHLKEH